MPLDVQIQPSSLNYYLSNNDYIFTDSYKIHNIEISEKFIYFLEKIKNDFVHYLFLHLFYSYITNKKIIGCENEYKIINEKILNGVKKIKEYKNGYLIINDNQKIKFGRLLNKINKINSDINSDINSNINNKIENIVNKYKSWFIYSKKNNFKYLYGEDILSGYDTLNYLNYYSFTMLNNSCMNNKMDLLELYSKNKNKVKLLVLYDYKQKISGRALIWKLDNIDMYYMDRVYYSNDYILNMFHKYAIKNNMLFRSNKLSQNFSIFIPSNGKYIKKSSNWFKLKVKLNTKGIKKYPYMDSLYLKKGKIFTNKVSRIFSIHKILRDTSGKPKQGFYFLY